SDVALASVTDPTKRKPAAELHSLKYTVVETKLACSVLPALDGATRVRLRLGSPESMVTLRAPDGTEVLAPTVAVAVTEYVASARLDDVIVQVVAPPDSTCDPT